LVYKQIGSFARKRSSLTLGQFKQLDCITENVVLQSMNQSINQSVSQSINLINQSL